MAEKKILDNYFVLAEAASQANVPFTPGTLIIEDGGQAYYDPSTGTDISSRIIIGDQAGIEAALEEMDTALGELREAIEAVDGKLDVHAAVAGSAETAGHVKLYGEEGDATDGAMTQAAVKAALAGKAASSHTHAQSEVTGLEDAISGLEAKDEEIAGAVTAEAERAVAKENEISGALEAYKTTNDLAVKANADAIDILNGEGEGSVKKAAEAAAAAAAAEIVAGADEKYDTLKEIADYISSDTAGAAELSNKVTANEAAIKTLTETTIPAVDAKADKNAEDLSTLSGTVTSNAGTLASHMGETYETADPHGIASMKTALEAEIAAIGKIVRYE